MSTTVTYAANQYNVPAYQDTGYAQGTGNLSSYLIALATGSLTISGGAFTLTADANFGASFGLVSIYFKSRSANIATVGILRLANTDLIAFANAAHDANLTYSVNASNQHAFTGGDIALDAGKTVVLKSPDGTKTIRFGVDNDGNYGEM